MRSVREVADAAPDILRTVPDTTKKPPVFIVGCGGSGTTLLRMMPNAHPHIAIPPESNFITPAWKRYAHVQPFTDEQLEELLQFLEQYQEFQDFQLDRNRLAQRLRGLTDRTLSAALRVVYTEYAERHHKPRWGDKTPGYVEQIKRLNALFPDCLVIHLIRDARDASLSMLSRGVGPRTLYEAAEEWVGRVNRGRRDGTQRLGPSRYLEVYYEQLVVDPRAVLQRICEFIGEPMDERMLTHYRDAFAHLPASERAKHHATSQPVTNQQVGRWKRELTLRQALMIQAMTRTLLRTHGYELRRSPLVWLVYPFVACRQGAAWLVRVPRKIRRSVGKRMSRVSGVWRARGC